MTLRERIVAVMGGSIPDLTPFTVYCGLEPPGAADLPELGFVRSVFLYEPHTPNCETQWNERGGGIVEHIIHTPVGDLHKTMRQDIGYGSWWTVEEFIKTPDDYEPLVYMLNDTSYTPAEGAEAEANRVVGDRGVPFAWTPRMPLQRLWIEYTGYETLSYHFADCPDIVAGALDALGNDSRKIWPIIAASGVELVWCPENITSSMTSPRLYEQYALPYFEEIAAALHPAGKKLCAHVDGTLEVLVDLIARTPLDVIEAYNPPPDGDVPLSRALEVWPDKVMWVNFPSSVHLADDERIEALVRQFIAEAAPGNRFLLGVMENIPAQVGLRSMQAICRALHSR